MQIDPSASSGHLEVADVAAAMSAASAPPARGPWGGVLRFPAFRWVWFGAMGSSVGTWMEGVGVQWLMAEQTSSTVMLGWLAAAQLGPMLLLGLPAGVLVDWVDRRAMLLVTQAAMMVIAGLLAAASAFGFATPEVLIGLGLVNGVAMAFNTPAWQVLSPRLVPREELHRAIALMGMQFNLARVVGPAIAGVLMARYNATLLFALNAVSFVGVMLAVRATPPAPPPPPPPGGRAPLAEAREALRFGFGHAGVRAALISLVIFSMLAAPFQRMLPLFVSEVYREGEATYGLLLSAVGVGAVLGGLSLGRLPGWYPRHHLIPLAMLCTGAAMTAFCAATTATWGGIFSLVAGFFWIWSFSSLMTSVQLLVPDAMRGRVLSVVNMAMFGAMPLGSVLSAVLGERAAAGLGGGSDLAVQLGVGTLTLALTLAGLVLLIWRTPELDDLRPGDHGHTRRPGLWAGVSASGHRPR